MVKLVGWASAYADLVLSATVKGTTHETQTVETTRLLGGKYECLMTMEELYCQKTVQLRT